MILQTNKEGGGSVRATISRSKPTSLVIKSLSIKQYETLEFRKNVGQKTLTLLVSKGEVVWIRDRNVFAIIVCMYTNRMLTRSNTGVIVEFKDKTLDVVIVTGAKVKNPIEPREPRMFCSAAYLYGHIRQLPIVEVFTAFHSDELHNVVGESCDSERRAQETALSDSTVPLRRSARKRQPTKT